jgi:3'(2'), 5'-bisphosphate nucleotidase
VPTFDATAGAALIDELTKIVAHAAAAVLARSTATGMRIKADGSPVTDADEAAEAIICESLARIAPGVSVISEEQSARETPTAAVRGSYFLVDPLDGTREFIAGRDEYTINIALVANGVPVVGIICAPALGDCWRGVVGKGADRIPKTANNPPIPIHIRPRPRGETVVVVSRSHLDVDTRAYVEDIPHAKTLQSGSSIKFCRIAEGSADLYPRLAPTHDWDIAAGHAILRAAGGSVTAPDGAALVYGTKELLIPGFIARGDIRD